MCWPAGGDTWSFCITNILAYCSNGSEFVQMKCSVEKCSQHFSLISSCLNCHLTRSFTWRRGNRPCPLLWSNPFIAVLGDMSRSCSLSDRKHQVAAKKLTLTFLSHKLFCVCERVGVRVFPPAKPPVPEKALVYAGWPPAAGCSDTSCHFCFAPVLPPLPFSCIEKGVKTSLLTVYKLQINCVTLAHTLHMIMAVCPEEFDMSENKVTVILLTVTLETLYKNFNNHLHTDTHIFKCEAFAIQVL